MLPALIAGNGDRAALRFLEYFTVDIRNRSTRAAYARAAADFLRWCEGQGIGELGWLRLHEKNGKLNEMRCHHRFEEYLDAYIKAAGIADDRKWPLFRSAIGKTAQLTDRPMRRGDVWSTVRRRASDAGIETAIGCHTFRATA